MRFLADGPSIPDELLIARDEGRVIFFCGAGVSRARAGLADFFELAEKVVETLGVTADNPVCKIIEEARELDRRTGIPGLISADRFFGLLEREFLNRDIETAVAQALKPKRSVDLTAHQIMLNLARSSEGKIRLVTTNFDLLFEACNSSLKSSTPPRLPDPKRAEEFDGIIHLHGCVDKKYKEARGDGFVLSSSEFGHAYLADGWATQFIRSILEMYVVVFIGYAADDPPVHYLLEALNKRPNSSQKMYAFQVGTQNDAEARWGHKGVVPIAYEDTEGHESLWDTLEAWAERALDIDTWYGKIIDIARKGPEALLPHERGQVAHLVSFPEGARNFAGSDNPPPAEWLCVFDPAIRFLKPARLGSYLERGPFFDPFEAYGLESDPVPEKFDPADLYAKRDVPPGVWSCFTPTSLDLHNLQESNYAALRGQYSVNVPSPPLRLLHVGQWICKVSDQPAAVWWAAHQVGVHQNIQSRIIFELERHKKVSSPVIRKAWHYIFEGWKREKSDAYQKWFHLKPSIDLDGWTNSTIRKLARIFRPYLKVEWPYWGGPKPPLCKDDVQLRELVDLSVEYPEFQEHFEIPDEFLVTAVREFRNGLEYAVSLEYELNRNWLSTLCPIEPDPDLGNESYERNQGISRSLLLYVDIFKRLIALDPLSAKREFQAWWEDNDTIFARLRIWAAGQRKILDGSEAGRLLCNLNDEVFWNSRHQRDFLLTLKQRWNEIPATIRKRLEKRLLRGCLLWKGEIKDEYTVRRAWESLNRIHWLEAEGCKFSFDLKAECDRLQLLAPEWQLQYATKAAASREGRSGTVHTVTEYSALLGEPLDNLLTKARELSGREYGFVQKDPFEGLSSACPVRALSALHHAVKKGENPEPFWRTFLYSAAREKDKSRFMALVAGRLANLPANDLASFILPASDWLLKASKILFASYPEKFELVWSKIIEVLRSESEYTKAGKARGNKEPAWATEALNAPVGKLAQAIMNDPQKEGLKAGKGFPVRWSNRVEELLRLPGDHRRYALVMFAFNLNWFFNVDPTWTEKNLLTALESEVDDQEALWEGFFWAAKIPNKKLYLRLKPHMIDLVLNKHAESRREVNILSGILLAGWVNTYEKIGKRFIANEEMKKILLNADDHFRGQILWNLQKLISDGKKGGWKDKLPVFFTKVWPRQKQARSPKMSARLCDMAFSNENLFPVVADTILPLLTKIDGESFVFSHIRGANNEIVKKYPEKLLTLLWATLPESAARWAYGIGEMLIEVGEVEPSLLHDSRLVELKRRWNTR